MKLTQRLQTVARDAAEQARDRARERLGRGEEAAPPAPDEPGNRPRAAFVGILDGRHLWLAVDATPGSLALRETGTDRVVPLGSDLAEDDPRYRSVRTDLRSIPGTGVARFEVVITAPAGKVYRVWTPPLPGREPVRTPASEGVQWQVARSEDGTLHLVREPAPAGAMLLDIEAATDDTVTLHIGGVPAGSDLRLVDDESGEVLLTRPFNVDGDVAVATLTPADIPEGVGLSASVLAGDLPVRRRASDLARPDNAVMLPQVQNPEPDGPLFSIIYRWLPDGVLRVRRPKGVQT